MQSRCSPSRYSKYLAPGFSLIELMIVVGVIAILAAIAYPNYRDYVVNSRRSAAAACLQEKAQLMERHYTTHLSYEAAGVPGGCDAGVNTYYDFSFDGTPGGRTFTLQATPTAQQSDSKCGTLSINEQGVRTADGSGSATECW